MSDLMRDEQLDAIFSALSDPTRRAMLARLSKGQATVNELAQPFELTQPAISKHLKVLEKAGFITRGKAAQTRPCRLETKRLKDVARWVEAYRHLWDDSFDRLDRYLTTAQTPVAKGRKHASKNRKKSA